MSREIRFDHQGHRSTFLLDIIELGASGLVKVGTWNSSEGLNITRHHAAGHVLSDESSLQNKTFVVLHAIVSKI